MKNLLVPTDFSPESHHAFELALQLAHRLGGNVTLLHVVELPDSATFNTSGGPGSGLPDGGIDATFIVQLLHATKQRLNDLVAHAGRTAPGVPVHEMLRTARIGPTLLQAIEDHQIDLVVIGAQGHTAWEHFFLGSNSERLVRLAPCPVLTVKHAVADFDPRHIVFPSDFTEEADHAVAGLRRVQALFPEAELHLLHVTACEGATEHAAARARIMAFAARHNLANVRPAVMCTLSPSAGIPDYAHQVGADLVVVATHGRTGLSRFLQSSIAETVATHAFPPVLTFHFDQPLYNRPGESWSGAMANAQII